MPEIRKDPFSDIWVIYAPERKLRPQYNKAPGEVLLSPEECPFCEGNESMTPPEVYALRDKGSEADKPGWRLRVIPNKYPALGGGGESAGGREARPTDGFYERMTGVGVHEVVIETNSHHKEMERLEVEEIVDIFQAFKNRVQYLKKNISIRYIQVFKGHGVRAGGTIPHPHSQVVAMPVVPARVRERLDHAEAYFKSEGHCIFCDMIHYEGENRKRVSMENPDYIVLAPYASRLPFELVVYPRVHSAFFEETEDESLKNLAVVFKETMRRINKALGNPDYCLFLHNAPITNGAFLGRGRRPHFHWHLELIPMVSGTGGFELGTYTYINPTLPEEAIEVLRAV